jgi:hypothetical protein
MTAAGRGDCANNNISSNNFTNVCNIYLPFCLFTDANKKARPREAWLHFQPVFCEAGSALTDPAKRLVTVPQTLQQAGFSTIEVQPGTPTGFVNIGDV